MRQTIALDVDGVIRDMVTPSMNIYRQVFDKSFNLSYNDMVHYNMETYFPKIRNIQEQIFRHYASDVFLDGPLYDREIPEMIKELHSKYDILILTNQPNTLQKSMTAEYLRHHNIEYDALIFSKDKWKVPNDIFLDDFVKNLEDMSKFRPSTTVVCMSQPWNKDWKGYKVNSFREFYNVVK